MKKIVIQKLIKELQMLLDIKQTGPMPVNTYILKDEISKEAIIIDTL